MVVSRGTHYMLAATHFLAAVLFMACLDTGAWSGGESLWASEPSQASGDQSDESPGAASATQPWTSGRHALTVDGLDRSLLLDVPQSLKPGAPLVFVFHGYTDSAENIRETTGFAALIEQHGFVAVYPQGTKDSRNNTFFNVGYAFHADSQVDDVRFVSAICDRLVKDLGVDADRIFATGMSNGGDMSYFLAAQDKPIVRAIAPVAGTMMNSWGQELVPARRLSIFHVHGTDDKTTLWGGDPANRDGWGAYLGVDQVLRKWTDGMKLETVTIKDLDARVRLHRWSTSTDDIEVRLFRIAGGGHEWPKHLSDPQRSTATEIWDFFELHGGRVVDGKSQRDVR